MNSNENAKIDNYWLYHFFINKYNETYNIIHPPFTT